MNLQEIKQKVEETFKIVDITERSRKGPVVLARRLAIWYAKEKGYRYNRITDEWGFGHDVCIYHINYINDMIKLGHKETTDNIWNTFGVDVTKDRTLEKLKRIHNSFDDILMKCPNRDLNELIERVEIMVKAYNHKHVSNPGEFIVSNALKIE